MDDHTADIQGILFLFSLKYLLSKLNYLCTVFHYFVSLFLVVNDIM